jgi:hypothetical protein
VPRPSSRRGSPSSKVGSDGARTYPVGKINKTRTHCQDALKVAASMRFRPEVALAGSSLPSCSWSTIPTRRPMPLSTWASLLSEFREMKMQPSLERASRHKEILWA